MAPPTPLRARALSLFARVLATDLERTDEALVLAEQAREVAVLTGTPNVPALYAATAGYDLVEEVGVAEVAVANLLALAKEDEVVGIDVGAPEAGGEVVGVVGVYFDAEGEVAAFPGLGGEGEEAAARFG